MQIRGINGETDRGNNPEAVFDISNKRRLGKSEKELIQDMINGVRALAEAELAANSAAQGVQQKGKEIEQGVNEKAGAIQ